MKTLFDGRNYDFMAAMMDRNGNKTAKIFFSNGEIEFIKDARLPLSCDKFYKSYSGLRNCKKPIDKTIR